MRLRRPAKPSAPDLTWHPQIATELDEERDQDRFRSWLVDEDYRAVHHSSPFGGDAPTNDIQLFARSEGDWVRQASGPVPKGKELPLALAALALIRAGHEPPAALDGLINREVALILSGNIETQHSLAATITQQAAAGVGEEDGVVALLDWADREAARGLRPSLSDLSEQGPERPDSSGYDLEL